ncbi:MAG: DMT family transporter [Bdellovibrionales bacterium]|nr:DMT family transporter [Bdellovibrionales bacterium]
MIGMILLSFLAGLFISVSRVVISKQSLEIGALASSFWNHIVGLIFILSIVLFSGEILRVDFVQIPWPYFLGGVIGASFVAINSWVIPTLGATKTIVFIIGFQMLSSTLIDFYLDKIHQLPHALLGVTLIVCGFLCKKFWKKI